MGVYLVCTAGNSQGRIWRFGQGWATLGRADDCEVVLDDNLVSRQHCRFHADANEVTFEDLKGLNPVLVNGLPVTRAVLRPGDQIAIGSSQLLVAGDAAMPGSAGGGMSSRPTVSWNDAAPIWMHSDTARDQISKRPGTIQDLVFLYDTVRVLDTLRGLDEVLLELKERLYERFHPTRLWIARVAGREVDLAGMDEQNKAAFPHTMARDAVQRGHGLLVPEVLSGDGPRSCRFTLAAPVSGGGATTGIIVMQTETPEGAYDEEDLRLLVLLSQLLGPILYSVEAFEQLRRDNECLRLGPEYPLELIGQSRAMGHIRRLAHQAATSDLHIVVTGETGTGKELVARLIHQQGPNRTQPFIVVNCAAIPKDLFESEFFGYEKGAFTGAAQRAEGMLAQANGGSLFLDEVGDLSIENQARILRAIELGTFRRIGGKHEEKVRVRVIAATNKDLAAAIAQGQFRKDLYHRLSGFEIHIPPLRERPSDIPVLAEYFLQAARHKSKRPLRGFSPQAIELLKERLWPGNVRELRTCILRAVSVTGSEEIQPRDIQSGMAVAMSEDGQPMISLADMEKQYITTALRMC
ncbi:MAG TPA: sigma 54-interacting transcriptional regulator, partial [Candidatus Hydrogenedentes bacterium]|nr:sigma 54-interacting transcriptional regulator [Candidatus Hydrogenedentota bacterium]